MNKKIKAFHKPNIGDLILIIIFAIVLIFIVNNKQEVLIKNGYFIVKNKSLIREKIEYKINIKDIEKIEKITKYKDNIRFSIIVFHLKNKEKINLPVSIFSCKNKELLKQIIKINPEIKLVGIDLE